MTSPLAAIWFGTVFCAASLWASATGAADTPLLQGQLLRSEIDTSYRQLRASKTLSDRVGEPNDVSDVVDKYILPGMSVAQATAILRAAGCYIDASRAGIIYARAAMKDGMLQVKHTWSVELDTRVDVVDTVSARIFTKYRVYDAK